MLLLILSVFVLTVFIPGASSESRQLDLQYFNETATGAWYYYKKLNNVPSNESLDITLIGWMAEDVSCQCNYYQNVFDTTFEVINNNTVIKVSNVTDEMSTLWQCTLKESNISFKDLYFEISVKYAKPPQIILINNLVLPTQKDSPSQDEILKYFTTYSYGDGDKVDVACINPENKTCTLNLSYDYAANIDDMFNTVSSTLRVGVRMELRTKHNMSRMICSYTCDEYPSTEVLVTFVLSEKLNDTAYLKINGTKVRGTRGKQINDSAINMYYKYAYFGYDKPSIFEYSSSRDDVVLKSICTGCLVEHANDSYNRQKISPDIISKMYYNVSDKDGADIIEYAQIGFVALDPVLDVQNQLKMDLQSRNIDIELYEHNTKQLKYYKYDEGEQLSLTCSKDSEIPSYLNFNGTDEWKENSLTDILHLNATFDNTVVTCALKQSNDSFHKLSAKDNTLEEIRLLLRIKKVNDTDHIFMPSNKNATETSIDPVTSTPTLNSTLTSSITITMESSTIVTTEPNPRTIVNFTLNSTVPLDTKTVPNKILTSNGTLIEYVNSDTNLTKDHLTPTLETLSTTNLNTTSSLNKTSNPNLTLILNENASLHLNTNLSMPLELNKTITKNMRAKMPDVKKAIETTTTSNSLFAGIVTAPNSTLETNSTSPLGIDSSENVLKNETTETTEILTTDPSIHKHLNKNYTNDTMRNFDETLTKDSTLNVHAGNSSNKNSTMIINTKLPTGLILPSGIEYSNDTTTELGRLLSTNITPTSTVNSSQILLTQLTESIDTHQTKASEIDNNKATKNSDHTSDSIKNNIGKTAIDRSAISPLISNKDNHDTSDTIKNNIIRTATESDKASAMNTTSTLNTGFSKTLTNARTLASNRSLHKDNPDQSFNDSSKENKTSNVIINDTTPNLNHTSNSINTNTSKTDTESGDSTSMSSTLSHEDTNKNKTIEVITNNVNPNLEHIYPSNPEVNSSSITSIYQTNSSIVPKTPNMFTNLTAAPQISLTISSTITPSTVSTILLIADQTTILPNTNTREPPITDTHPTPNSKIDTNKAASNLNHASESIKNNTSKMPASTSNTDTNHSSDSKDNKTAVVNVPTTVPSINISTTMTEAPMRTPIIVLQTNASTTSTTINDAPVIVPTIVPPTNTSTTSTTTSAAPIIVLTNSSATSTNTTEAPVIVPSIVPPTNMSAVSINTTEAPVIVPTYSSTTSTTTTAAPIIVPTNTSEASTNTTETPVIVPPTNTSTTSTNMTETPVIVLTNSSVTSTNTTEAPVIVPSIVPPTNMSAVSINTTEAPVIVPTYSSTTSTTTTAASIIVPTNTSEASTNTTETPVIVPPTITSTTSTNMTETPVIVLTNSSVTSTNTTEAPVIVPSIVPPTNTSAVSTNTTEAPIIVPTYSSTTSTTTTAAPIIVPTNTSAASTNTTEAPVIVPPTNTSTTSTYMTETPVIVLTNSSATSTNTTEAPVIVPSIVPPTNTSAVSTNTTEAPVIVPTYLSMTSTTTTEAPIIVPTNTSAASRNTSEAPVIVPPTNTSTISTNMTEAPIIVPTIGPPTNTSITSTNMTEAPVTVPTLVPQTNASTTSTNMTEAPVIVPTIVPSDNTTTSSTTTTIAAIIVPSINTTASPKARNFNIFDIFTQTTTTTKRSTTTSTTSTTPTTTSTTSTTSPTTSTTTSPTISTTDRADIMGSQITYTTNTSKDPNQNLMLIVIGIAAFVVLVCIIIVVYNMKKRNRLTVKRDPGCNYENLPGNPNNMTPEPQAQWAFAYANQEQNTPAVTRPGNELYAKPVPRNLRRKFISENIYANQQMIQADAAAEEIELVAINEVAPRLEADKECMYANQAAANDTSHCSNQKPTVELYSQVLPRSERNQGPDDSNENSHPSYINCVQPLAGSGSVQPIYGAVNKNKYVVN